jgi:hypothetical protein
MGGWEGQAMVGLNKQGFRPSTALASRVFPSVRGDLVLV